MGIAVVFSWALMRISKVLRVSDAIWAQWMRGYAGAGAIIAFDVSPPKP